jgi:Glycosyl-hydrolase family 116, catalytic region
VAGLGKLLPREHVRGALGSIYRYNFRRGFERFATAQRIYALNDEAGLLLCSWPHDKRPALPFVYSDEVWTGIEYQVAAHLIYEDMVEEGLSIVEAVRARYNGARRNPWDEVECGHHYARAMSSWSLLLALSGFGYSAPAKEMRLRPRVSATDFRCLFCAGSAWGVYSQKTAAGGIDAAVAVEEGRLELETLHLPFGGEKASAVSSHPAAASVEGGELVLRFKPMAQLAAGDKLTVSAVSG